MGIEPRRIISELSMNRSQVDRADRLRADAAALARLWGDPQSRLLVMYGDRVRIKRSDAGLAIDYSQANGMPEAERANCYFLGIVEGHAYFAATEPADRAADSTGSLREVGASLIDLDAELFCTTLALSNWHANHSHCSKCGEPTIVARSGWIRECPRDGSLHFPRTDPAVIMLVTNSKDEALLGRREVWPTGWYSTLAGFVEPGESAEAAVEREMMEEVSVVVDPNTIQCLGSQPWPFPSSLMIGFRAVAQDDSVPQPDGIEIAEAHWFSREEMAAKCQSGEVKIPPRFSIGRYLVEEWFGTELPGMWSRD